MDINIINSKELDDKLTLDPNRYIIDEDLKKLLNKRKKTLLSELAEIFQQSKTEKKENMFETKKILEDYIYFNNNKQISDNSKDLKKYDILILANGNLAGKTALIVNNPPKINIPSNIIVIRSKKKENVFSLYYFLRSDFGQNLLNTIKFADNNNNKKIRSISDLKQIKIPVFTKKEKDLIDKKITEEIQIFINIQRNKEKLMQTKIKNNKIIRNF